MMWVNRIMTINLEMIVPALVGRFLDRKFGVGFLAPVGMVLGLVLGISHLIALTRRSAKTDPTARRETSRPADSDDAEELDERP